MSTWSGIRNKLENDYLCPALRGRIQYFATSYWEAMTKQAGRPFDWTAWRCCEVTTTLMNRTTGTDIRPCGGRASAMTIERPLFGWPMKGH